MSNSSKIWTGVAIFIVMTVIVCAAIVRFSPEGSDMMVTFGFAGNAKLRRTTELDIGTNTELKITAHSENVYFYESDSSQLVIKEYYRSDSNKMLADISQTENKVIFEGNRVNHIILFGFVSDSEKIEVYLPENYVVKLDTEVSSGRILSDLAYTGNSVSLAANSGGISWDRITAEKISLKVSSGGIDMAELDGEITAKANSGNITLGKVQGPLDVRVTSGKIVVDEVSGDLTTEANSGNISVSRSEGFIRAHATSGKITLQEVKGGVDVSASSGNVNLELVEIKDNVDVRVKSGSINIEIPDDSEFTFQADTNSGSIRTDFDDSLSFDRKGDSAEGTVGSNPQYKITAKASSGSIRVNY